MPKDPEHSSRRGKDRGGRAEDQEENHACEGQKDRAPEEADDQEKGQEESRDQLPHGGLPGEKCENSRGGDCSVYREALHTDNPFFWSTLGPRKPRGEAKKHQAEHVENPVIRLKGAESGVKGGFLVINYKCCGILLYTRTFVCVCLGSRKPIRLLLPPPLHHASFQHRFQHPPTTSAMMNSGAAQLIGLAIELILSTLSQLSNLRRAKANGVREARGVESRRPALRPESTWETSASQ